MSQREVDEPNPFQAPTAPLSQGEPLGRRFTIIEKLVILLIIAVLAALLLPVARHSHSRRLRGATGQLPSPQGAGKGPSRPSSSPTISAPHPPHRPVVRASSPVRPIRGLPHSGQTTS